MAHGTTFEGRHLIAEFIWKKRKSFRWVKYEFEPKDKSFTIRISKRLLELLKKKAEEAGVDYQKYIRMKLEHSIFDDAA